MIERWLSVRDNPRYSVSSFGNVYDDVLERELIQTRDGVRKSVAVHRLVADAFYAADITELEVNHLDGDKSNNAVWNLELCDRSEQMIHAFNNGLARPTFPVQRVRIVETGEEFNSTGQCDRYLGVSAGSVSKTLRGLQPTCRGYTFEII